jgi:hypothetical protein
MSSCRAMVIELSKLLGETDEAAAHEARQNPAPFSPESKLL